MNRFKIISSCVAGISAVLLYKIVHIGSVTSIYRIKNFTSEKKEVKKTKIYKCYICNYTEIERNKTYFVPGLYDLIKMKEGRGYSPVTYCEHFKLKLGSSLDYIIYNEERKISKD